MSSVEHEVFVMGILISSTWNIVSLTIKRFQLALLLLTKGITLITLFCSLYVLLPITYQGVIVVVVVVVSISVSIVDKLMSTQCLDIQELNQTEAEILRLA